MTTPMRARLAPASTDAASRRPGRAGAPPAIPGVLHLVDTLEVGGAERVAVNLVNAMPRDQFAAHLCTTRHDGPLVDLVAAHVPRLALNRRTTLDLHALRRLVLYARAHGIRVLHAHGSAVFLAALARAVEPSLRVVWHVHYGRYAVERNAGWAYRVLRGRLAHVVAVSEALADWAARRARMAPDRVTYLPNSSEPNTAAPAVGLPGTPGARLVCVANLVPEKDHVTLVRAMATAAREHPDAQLLLVGAPSDARTVEAVRAEIAKRGLGDRVHLLGQRRDVASVLQAVDVGVLSSRAEGLPLALLEYGAAALPVVVTRVGQCPAVVADGAGVCVPPQDPAALAGALLEVLRSPEMRARLGAALHARVWEQYNLGQAVSRLADVYRRVLDA